MRVATRCDVDRGRRTHPAAGGGGRVNSYAPKTRYVSDIGKSQERVLGGKAMSESLECIGSESNMQIPSESRSKPHTLRTQNTTQGVEGGRACRRVRQSSATTSVVCALVRHLAMPGPRPIRHAKVRRAKLRRLGAAGACRLAARHHGRARRRCFGKRGVTTSCKYQC